jgi:hypothetical protein
VPMTARGEAGGADGTLHIGFPVKCRYRGGNRSLGGHGVHLWVTDDRIGHGELHPTHTIPLADVTSVDVNERLAGGSEGRELMAAGLGVGLGSGGMGAGRGPGASSPVVVTDVIAGTRDGQDALWVVEGRNAAWVRERLTPVLRAHHIPYYDDLPPGQRSTYP